VQQKHCTNDYQGSSPCEWVSIKTPGNDVLFIIRRKARTHELRSSTSIDSGKQPRAQNAEHKEMHALSQHGHLEETGKDGEVNNRFGGLSVIGGAEAWDE